MEYTVVSSSDLTILIGQVNSRLEKGWALQGGISACETMNQGYTTKIFAQAMIKETK